MRDEITVLRACSLLLECSNDCDDVVSIMTTWKLGVQGSFLRWKRFTASWGKIFGGREKRRRAMALLFF